MEYAKTDLPVYFSIHTIITVSTVDFAQIAKIEGEKHSFLEVNCVKSGTLKIAVDGVKYEYGEGQMLIYSPNAYHEKWDDCDSVSYILSFEADESGFEALYNRVLTLTPRQMQTIGQIVEDYGELFRILDECEGLRGMVPKDNVDVFKLQKLKNQLEFLFLDIYQTDKTGISNHTIRSKEQFDLAVQYMKSNISRNPSLEDIAKHCSISISKLKMVFKEQCDDSPISYLIKLKIDEAKVMMTETSQNFSQISDSLGFTSVHYFSKLFKKKTGMTPSEYVKFVEKKGKQ